MEDGLCLFRGLVVVNTRQKGRVGRKRMEIIYIALDKIKVRRKSHRFRVNIDALNPITEPLGLSHVIPRISTQIVEQTISTILVDKWAYVTTMPPLVIPRFGLIAGPVFGHLIYSVY
mgnify:CR=1 FL=1